MHIYSNSGRSHEQHKETAVLAVPTRMQDTVNAVEELSAAAAAAAAAAVSAAPVAAQDSHASGNWHLVTYAGLDLLKPVGVSKRALARSSP